MESENLESKKTLSMLGIQSENSFDFICIIFNWSQLNHYLYKWNFNFITRLDKKSEHAMDIFL